VCAPASSCGQLCGAGSERSGSCWSTFVTIYFYHGLHAKTEYRIQRIIDASIWVQHQKSSDSGISRHDLVGSDIDGIGQVYHAGLTMMVAGLESVVSALRNAAQLVAAITDIKCG